MTQIRIRSILSFIAALAVSFIVAKCSAGIVLSPGTVLQNTMGEIDSANAFSNAIDQSGLSHNYTSGVTDFDAFVGVATNDLDGIWVSAAMNPPLGVVDFDLGANFTLEGLAIWNFKATSAVREFEVFRSTDSAFTSPVSIGAFTAAQNANSSPLDAQTFTFSAPADTQYVRIEVQSNHGATFITGLGELAFEAQAIPEPSTVVLSMVGMALLIAPRRRQPEKGVSSL